MTRACAHCGHPVRPRGVTIPGVRCCVARGLCSACYFDPEIRADHDRIKRSWDELEDDVAILLDRTSDPAIVAAALAMTPGAIARAAHRHGRSDLARPFFAAQRRLAHARRAAA